MGIGTKHKYIHQIIHFNHHITQADREKNVKIYTHAQYKHVKKSSIYRYSKIDEYSWALIHEKGIIATNNGHKIEISDS